MANSKIIVVEGAQGAGKTTITDYIRNTLSYTNLYRLCGTSDSTITGKKKAREMYEDLLEYMKKMENKSINLLFDRTFFTEENYCRLGKKEYSFTDVYERLLQYFAGLDFEIYYITLYLEDESKYSERLNRGEKAVFKGSEFASDNSRNQQKVYLQIAAEIKERYPNINVFNVRNDRPEEETKAEIREILKY